MLILLIISSLSPPIQPLPLCSPSYFSSTLRFPSPICLPSSPCPSSHLAFPGLEASRPNPFMYHNFAAYLDKGEHNIIAVDWSRLSPGPCYPSAVYNTRFIGKCIAQMVEVLRLEGASDIHLVGFSLGAHVAGFAANSLRPYKLPRITGTCV
jgi:pimeloyl-ACP methyl ester carboxylesterase